MPQHHHLAVLRKALERLRCYPLMCPNAERTRRGGTPNLSSLHIYIYIGVNFEIRDVGSHAVPSQASRSLVYTCPPFLLLEALSCASVSTVADGRWTTVNTVHKNYVSMSMRNPWTAVKPESTRVVAAWTHPLCIRFVLSGELDHDDLDVKGGFLRRQTR